MHIYNNITVDFLFTQVLKMSSTCVSPRMDKSDHGLLHILKGSRGRFEWLADLKKCGDKSLQILNCNWID
jgi:hypothetical protein